MTAPAADRRFVGVWRLEAIQDSLSNGQAEGHPDFGPDPDGLLIYTESGYVSVQFLRRIRPPWRKDDDPTQASLAAAARGYGAYAGRFEVDEAAGAVHHHVQIALIPNRVGLTLTRFFSFAKDRLTLRPPRLRRGGVEVDRALVWRRVA
jgi:hypothetical protein